MKREEIKAKINEFLIDELEVEESKLDTSSDLKKDLGIDSLDFVDIAVIIEKSFGIKIKGEEMVGMKTLGDFYDFIIERVGSD